MSACQRTAALEALLSRGLTPTPDLVAHAAACSTCRRTLDKAARLETDLGTTVAAMVTEPMPPARELLDAGGPRAVWSPRRILAGLAAAAAVVVLLVGASVVGQLIGTSPPAPGAGPPGSRPSVGSVPDDMAGWAAAADESILDHMDRHLEPDLTLVRLERCDDIALAFFADPEAPSGGPFVFGMGEYRQPPFEAGFGGMASSLDEPEAAHARSQHAPCEVVLDTVVAAEDALAAYRAFLADDAGRVSAVRVLATKMVTLDVALAFIDEVRVSDGRPHQQIVVLRRDADGWVLSGAQGGDYPVAGAAVGVSPLGVAKGMPDDRRVAVGVVDDGVVAIELEFSGFTHRYPVDDGAFVIQIPADTGFGLPYRLLDATGAVTAAGTSQP